MAESNAEKLKMFAERKPRGIPLTDRFGNTFYVGNCGDFYISPFPLAEGEDYRDLVKTCQQTKLKDGDVIMVSFPKTGTHWTRAIIDMLSNNTSEHQKDEAGLLEMGWGDFVKDKPSPRHFNTHLPFRCLPKEAFTKKVKIVLCNRNPKDTLVSLYHHSIKMVGQMNWPGTFEEFFWFRMELGGHYGDLLDYYMDWQKGMEENPQLNVCETVFEEMKEDPVAAVSRLNDFLETDCSPEMCKDIAHACSFDQLKAAKDQKEPEFQKMFFKDKKPCFYRKGEVGDWKTHFTVAMNDYFDEQYKKRMASYKRIYKYTL